MKIQIYRIFSLLFCCWRREPLPLGKPRLLVLLAAALLLFLSLQPSAFSAEKSDKWQGVDESVVEKYAKEYGREASKPFINTDQGDLLLFVFLLAGAVGGFAAGYFWRSLTENKIKKSAFAVLLVLCALSYSAVAAAEDAPNFKEDTLTGDWGGSRTKMNEKGINWEIIYKADLLSNISGGIKRNSEYMDNLDIKLKLEGDKTLGWKGMSALLYFLRNQGGKLNGRDTGSFMGVSNIEVNTNTAKLYQAWLAQSLADDKFLILTGLYDLNSEFYSTDSSGLFLHPTCGIGPELAQTGFNGPSIFPTASLGVRVKWQPSPMLSVQAVALDAVPGNPKNQQGTHIIINTGEGALLVSEIALHPAIYGYRTKPQKAERTDPGQTQNTQEEKYEPVSKYAVGVWRYTARFDDLTDKDITGAPLKRINHGIYFLLEQSVYHEKDDMSKGMAVFVRGGVTVNSMNHIDRYIGAGLKYKGLFPKRDSDQLGLSVARVYSGSKYKQSMLNTGTPVENSEAALELTYRVQITPWLAVQPDIQFIINPGLDPKVKNTWVAGSRVEISF